MSNAVDKDEALSKARSTIQDFNFLARFHQTGATPKPELYSEAIQQGRETVRIIDAAIERDPADRAASRPRG